MPVAVVFGSTGAQGGPVAHALLDHEVHVRAVTRDTARARVLVERGAEPVAADLRDPDSVAAAAKGADLAFLHRPMSLGGPDADAVEKAAIAALKRAGVGHLVYNTGMAVPDAPVGHPMLDARVAAIQRLLDDDATVLVPTGYMENFSAAWSAPLVAAGELVYPRPADDRVAWLTNDDVGAATAAALDRGASAQGTLLRLAGPEALTFPEVADRLGRALGRDVRFRSISGAEYGEVVGRVLGPQAGAMIGAAYDAMPTGPNPLMTPDTTRAREVLGIDFTPLEVWARRQDWHATG